MPRDNGSSSRYRDFGDETKKSKTPNQSYFISNNRMKRGSDRNDSQAKKPKPMSAKEREILNRQRQLAQKLLSNSSTIDKNKKSQLTDLKSNSSAQIHHTSSIVSSKQDASNYQQKLLQKNLQRDRLKQLLQPTDAIKRPSKDTNPMKTVTSKKTVAKHLRPTLRPRGLKPTPTIKTATTAADALAAARDRLNLPTKMDKSNDVTKLESATTEKIATSSSISPTSKSDQIKATMRKRLLQRKSTSSNNKSNFGNSIFARVEIEDYWRMIRGWDFLHELNAHVQSQKNRNNPPQKNSANRKQQVAKKNTRTSKRGYQVKNERDFASKDVSRKDFQSERNNQQEGGSPISNKIATHIPDSFDSPHQYVSIWAPLCLKETKAQMISEFITSHGAANRCKHPIKVKVSSLNKDVGGSSDYITLQIRTTNNFLGENRNFNGKNNTNDSTYMVNDIVILAKEGSKIQSAFKGQIHEDKGVKYIDNNEDISPSLLFPNSDSDNRRYGFLGQVEQHKKSPDGLCLKVSRKLWVAAGATEMHLVKLGSNITALREFTALCRIDSIPLIHDILSCKNSAGSTLQKKIQKSTPFRDKQSLIANMGGPVALGKGFTEYASKKFNNSQLGAISAAAQGYGEGGFTLVKGPPGTGKTTTLVALLNSLHIRQFNKYYNAVGKIAAVFDSGDSSKTSMALESAAKSKPRLLVCAPSNAAVDNVILKIMADGFVDGNGSRYNPSMVRIGVGQSASVKDIALEAKVDALLSEGSDLAHVETTIGTFRVELIRLQRDISKLRRRIQALTLASPWPLSKEWEIRIDEDTFDRSGRVYFVNHKEKRTSYEIPPPADPGEQQYTATSMPEYRTHLGTIVKLVERYNTISSKLQRTKLIQTISEKLAKGNGRHSHVVSSVRQQLETHVVDSVHIVLTTLGTAGSRSLELAEKFEVVVIDEAAQSVEPATLVALQLGSSQAVLVGDPQQLPATIFSVSGRSTKYDRSLFQRLEEGGYPVHMLDTQYRMNPCISDFPRRIFYDGNLLDGPNVQHHDYGDPLHRIVISKITHFQPFTVFDLDSSEERGGTSLANSSEARFALHLYKTLVNETNGLASRSRVAVITPYAQQASLLRRTFSQQYGEEYTRKVEVNTVDAFQGRESNIVIFSCVRAAGSKGIGFLSDVRRMNVALTRAKHFLFVIARCTSIIVNPYWRDLVNHARENKAVIEVPLLRSQSFPELKTLRPLPPLPKRIIAVSKTTKTMKSMKEVVDDSSEDGEVAALFE